MKRLLGAGLALAALAASAAAALAQAIPDSPEKLTFPPIAYQPPRAQDYRVVLKNGMVVYIAEDKALPLVNVAVTVRAGSWLEPEGKEGLAAFTGSQMRRGGTERLSADELDEKLDFLAAQVGTGIGTTAGSASLNCLADNLDEALPLFVDVLRRPRFQEDRLALAKEQTLQEMQKRNDDPEDIEGREWGVLLYGPSHFTNRFTTEASVRSITREDMIAFHRRQFYPANMIAAVSGSFDRATMLRKLEEAFAGWPSPRTTTPPIPDTIGPAAPGLYRIQKDVPQGRVSIGLPTIRRDHPDVYALEVMNEILGGSGFTSRITKTVRSNEGLAYSAGSGLAPGVWFPGRFRAGFQSKSRTVPWATELVLGEIRRIRDEGVTPEAALDDQEQPRPDVPVELRLEGAGDGHLRVRRVHAPRPGVLGDVPRPHPGRHRGRRAARGAHAPRAREDGCAGGRRPEADRPRRPEAPGGARATRAGREGRDAAAARPDDDEAAAVGRSGRMERTDDTPCPGRGRGVASSPSERLVLRRPGTEGAKPLPRARPRWRVAEGRGAGVRRSWSRLGAYVSLFWNAATKSFSAKGLLLLTFPVRKSFAPSSWRPFHTSRKSVAGPLK